MPSGARIGQYHLLEEREDPSSPASTSTSVSTSTQLQKKKPRTFSTSYSTLDPVPSAAAPLISPTPASMTVHTSNPSSSSSTGYIQHCLRRLSPARLLALISIWVIISLVYSSRFTADSMPGTIPVSSTGSPLNHPEQKTFAESVGYEQFKSAFALKDLWPLYLPKEKAEPADRYLERQGDQDAFKPLQRFPFVRHVPTHEKKRILVTGGAGFVGSHLVDRLMKMGHEVIVLDNFFTGSKRNVQHWMGHPNFELIRHDVVDPFMTEVDEIYHLACPASPPHYQYNPIKTVKTSVLGTINMLGLAKRVRAKFLVTSTSEVYGDPEEHPQREDYWGHVNPIGPRACYDEGKRVAETLTYAYQKQDHVQVRVARIFNTFGPRMNENDGRVVSNFIMQALQNKDLTVYGSGSQTRSFQYVHDLVDGLIALMNSNYTQPVNLGNPDEYTIQEFAEMIRSKINNQVRIVNLPATTDDPQKRRPDITRAQTELGWQPKFPVEQGIAETVEYFKQYISDNY